MRRLGVLVLLTVLMASLTACSSLCCNECIEDCGGALLPSPCCAPDPCP